MTASSHGPRRAEFEVTARGYPLIRRHCPTCGVARAFECTGNFRVNAGGKLLDIWLLYHCVRCSFTYNLTVSERTPVARMDRELLEGATLNDKRLAGRFARDLGLLRRNDVQLERGDEWELEQRSPPVEAVEADELVFTMDPPLVVRADHLVAAALGLSRSRVTSALKAGQIELDSVGNAKALRLWEACRWIVRR